MPPAPGSSADTLCQLSLLPGHPHYLSLSNVSLPWSNELFLKIQQNFLLTLFLLKSLVSLPIVPNLLKEEFALCPSTSSSKICPLLIAAASRCLLLQLLTLLSQRSVMSNDSYLPNLATPLILPPLWHVLIHSLSW